MIFRARTVVTMEGAPIENGAVAVEGDKIVDVGGFDEVKARFTASQKKAALQPSAAKEWDRASRKLRRRDADRLLLVSLV